MSRFRKAFWFGTVLIAAPLPVAAQEICAALDRIAASSREPVPFESIRRALAAGEAVVPGFPPEECSVTAEAVSCHHHSMTLTSFDGWPDPLNCAGLVPAAPTTRGAWHRDRQYAFAAAGLRIDYGTHCMACAGPGSTHFRAGFERRRKRGD